jgi:hypothetical protein
LASAALANKAGSYGRNLGGQSVPEPGSPRPRGLSPRVLVMTGASVGFRAPLSTADLAALGSAHHHINPPAPAPRANKPGVPIRGGHLRAIALGHRGRVGLDLVAAIEAPDDQPHMRRSGVAKRQFIGRAASRTSPRSSWR